MSRPTTPLPSSAPPETSPSFASPPRSSTHPAKPRHHITHRPHRTHHHHHHHHDKSIPQSAIQPTTSNPFYGPASFGDFVTKTTTGPAKSDGGATPLEDVEGRQRREEADAQAREQAQWREVEKLRTERTAVDDSLRTTLTTLSSLSTSTTRRLDYTYYSLLSSVSSLTTTLSHLHTLSTTTSHLSTHFQTSTSSLTTSLQSQTETANKGFEAQARRISDLEKRMREGRERVKGLGERLEVVRCKVERSGEREREVRMAVGRRVRMLWGVLGVWGVLVMVGVAVRYWPSTGVDVRVWEGVDDGVRAFVEKSSVGGETARNVESRSVEATGTSVPEDPVLKLFDEL